MAFSKINQNKTVYENEEKILFYKDKIFRSTNDLYDKFRISYDCLSTVDLQCSYLKGYQNGCLHDELNVYDCECYTSFYRNCYFEEVASLGASLVHYKDDIYKILDWNSYCCCGARNIRPYDQESLECDCDRPQERVNAFAFLHVLQDYYEHHDLSFNEINYKRFIRVIKAIDNISRENDVSKLYQGLCCMFKTFDFSTELSFQKFMGKFYHALESKATSADLSYVPDLVMELKPELLAQVGDNLISSQSLRNRIDTLIWEADRLEAQSFFGVDVNIPESTSATLLTIISELRESVRETLTTAFKLSVMAVAAILYLVLAFVIIHRIVTLKPRYIAMMHIICTLAVLYNDETSCLHTLLNWCKERFSSVAKNEKVAEDGMIDSRMLSFLPLFAISSMNIPIKISEKLVTSKFLDSLGRKISFLGDARFYGGLNTINTWATQAFEAVKQHFYEWLGLQYVPDLSTEKDTYLEWTEKTERVIEEYYNRKLLFSESERSYITSLYSDGIKLARHPVYKVASQDILHVCRSLLIIVEKVNAKLNVSGSLRNPPVTLMLYGDTGAGKSSLTFPLSVAILLEVYKRENNQVMIEALKSNCHRLIYTRNSEQEFWDGYTGQTVCVFDDWNQMVDSASNPSMELFELIRASNVFPYPLHMAHLEDKASVNFSSDIIICSSNNQRPKVESLNFPKALIRRFTSFAHVERTLSDDKAFSFKDYTLTPYDPETGKRQEALTVEAFIAKAVDEYQINKGFVSSINTFVEGLFAQDGSGEPDRRATTALYEKFHLLKFKEKLENLKIEYRWLSMYNLPLIIGAITLIGAGLAMYQYFSKEESNAESSITAYVRARKNHMKVKTEEAYEPIVRSSRITTEDVIEAYEPVMRNQKIVTEDVTEAYESIVKNTKLTSEGCVDQVATEMGAKLARSNLYRVYLQVPNEEIPLGHCLFLKGNVAIIPMHFVHIMKSYGENNTIYFSNVQLDHVYETRVKDIQFTEYIDKYGNHKDIASFQLRHVREHADILNMFAPSGTLKTTGTTEIALILLNCVSPKYPLVLDRRYKSGHSCIKYIQNPEAYRLTAVNSLIKIHSAWEYSLETQKGDCGAPLMVLNDRIAPGKIIGIHVAGNTGIGMSTTMFLEDVKSICSSYSMFAQARTLELLNGTNPYGRIELDYLGDLEKPVIQPSKSKIIPSPLHNVLSVPKTDLTWLRPQLKDGEVFNPLEYRTQRMGKRSVCIPFDLVDLAREGLLREFKRVYLRHQDSLVGRFECPYSLETTCLGVDGEEFVNAIKRDTSAGFPFTQMGVTRSQIFGTEDIYRVDTPIAKEIFELVEFYEKSACEGVVLDHYFVDTLKDERKPIEKCHKTRMFAAGPIDYLIWSKRWFNGVVAIISELRNAIHVSVGTNVYSDDWHMMAEGLLRKSDLFVAGDFEGFDASEQAYILRAVLDVLIDFSQYIFGEDPFARVQMNAIAVGLIFSYHISGKNVFQWLKSLPSGHYLTAIANSIFVLIALSSAYLLALKRREQPVSSLDVDYFWEHFGLVAYGDDHVLAVPRSCASFYNQNTLVDLLREFGLYYTDELKSARGVSDTRPLTDISYLKRSFRFDASVGKWVAPLSIDVILETPMWIRKCPDIYQQTFNNIEFALRELSMHNDEIWDEYAPKLLSLAESKCKLVSKFHNKSTTLLFVLNTMMMAQSQDVIFDEKENMQGPNLRQLLSREEAVGIYPYYTGSAQAAPKHPVNLARLRRVGALEAEVFTPADTPQIATFSSDNTNEVKAHQYVDQAATDDSVQITTFENDLSIVTQDVPMPKPLETNLRSMHTDDAHHTIVSFLKRPMILREFTWNSSQNRGKDIFPKIRVPFDMIVRQFKQKLQGFMSFRATAVITVQFQTQPFQAGRFIMAAVPVPSLIGKRTAFIENRISNLTLLNHVQADIAKQTQVELRVPYISPLIAYDLVQGRYDWAEVVGKVYSPVTSVGTTDVEGIVYVHFEDVQLGAPTSQPIFEETSTLLAQSGSAQKKLPFEPDALTDIRQRAQEVGLTASNSSRATGALRKINGRLGEYLDFAKPVTDTLDKWLLKPVDDFLGPILNIFGFSKPIVEGSDKLLRPTTLFSTLEGHDRALTLATSDDVNAPFLPNLNGTNLDEMSFDYLKKIPQYIDYFTYSTTNNRNDCLYNFFVRPSFRAPENVSLNKEIYPQPSHLSFITEPFAYWTGSIVLTMKFVKTDYHSGRVEVTYHPNCNPMDSRRKVKANTDFDMAYRYIVDLREKSEISLRIPYIAVTPFKRNIAELLFPSDISTSTSLVELNSGVVVVRALTPLKASNAVVSNTIEVLVEYNAGNDFSVMNPITTRFNPVTPLEKAPVTTLNEEEMQSDWSGYYSDEVEELSAQSGEASTAGLAITRQQAIEGEDPPAITHNMGEVQPRSSSLLVTGENFQNFRDLVHRTNFVLKVMNSDNFEIAVNNFYIPPPLSKNLSGGLLHLGFHNRANSALGYVGSMYALCRGSVNVRVLPNQFKDYLGASLFFNDSTAADCMYPLAIENSSVKGLAEYHIPFYCRTYQFDHLKYNNSLLYDLNFAIATASPNIKIDASAAVSGGDDISFGYFIGTPFCLIPKTTEYPGGADPFVRGLVVTPNDGYVLWSDITVS
ncbi:polyprotein [Diversinervus elegans virus]|nr:polyprotein [Diversinervus elegans virus]